MVEGMLWILRTGAPWRDLPERYGPWRTVASRFYRWQKSGAWERVLGALQARPMLRGTWTGMRIWWMPPLCAFTSMQRGLKKGCR
jgi:transposase